MKKQKQLQQILLKNAIYKIKKDYVLLAFLSVTIALLIAVSIYYHRIKYYVRDDKLLNILHIYG